MKWVGLACRVVVGSVWLVAGILKLADPASTVRAVRAYELLPESAVPLVGHGLPVLEVLVGMCLLLGLLTRPAAAVSTVLLVAFVVGVGSAWARGLSIECGCFGGHGGPSANARAGYPWEIARDLGLVAMSVLLVWRPPTNWVVRTKETFLVAVGLAAALLLGVGIQTSRDTSGEAAIAPAGSSAYAVPAGESSAPVTVTVYEDFMCPFCGQFESVSRERLQRYVDEGTVQVEYHPLSFLDRASTTSYSSRAANAFAVVLDTSGDGVAKRFHDLLFEHQPAEGSAGLSDRQLVSLAVQAGARRSAVEGPIEDDAFGQWVVNTQDAASKAGVTSTPTVLVNGHQVVGRTVQDLADRLDSAIARS